MFCKTEALASAAISSIQATYGPACCVDSSHGAGASDVSDGGGATAGGGSAGIMAQETIYLCNFRVSVDGDWLCLRELSDVQVEMPPALTPNEDGRSKNSSFLHPFFCLLLFLYFHFHFAFILFSSVCCPDFKIRLTPFCFKACFCLIFFL